MNIILSEEKKFYIEVKKNAKQAYNISFENENIVSYVEKEISDEVEKSAKAGNYCAIVFVNFPDHIDGIRYQDFIEKALEAIKQLGYTVTKADGTCSGCWYDIEWKDQGR